MNKSFQESGGTVLSTNWGEIGKEQTPVKPPEGMEYKKVSNHAQTCNCFKCPAIVLTWTDPMTHKMHPTATTPS